MENQFNIKQYKYWEIVKLIEEKELRNNDYLTDMDGDEFSIHEIIESNYDMEFLINNLFTINNKEVELQTFEQVKKMGTPYHILTGYNYGHGYSAETFVIEMNKKVWRL